MTEHVTISLDEMALAEARQRASDLGVSLDDYLHRLIIDDMAARQAHKAQGLAGLIGMIPASAGPAPDIAKDKDQMIGEAVGREHDRSISRP